MPIIFDAPGITFGSLIEECVSNLQGYTAAPDQVTSLSAPLNLADTTVTVDDATVLSRGMIEVGTELMWVQNVSTTGNTATVLPKGRGWRGSTATTHQAGDTVVVSPAVPRFIVAREINNQLRSMYPSILAVNATEFVFDNPLKQGWGVPANADAILDVRWKDYQNNWQRINKWEAEDSANLTDFPTGRCIRLFGTPVGRTIRVVYGSAPQTLTSEVDPFSSTGLSDGSKDLVVLGVMARVVPNLDVSRLQVQYASAEEMGQARPHGGAITVAKWLMSNYQMRLRDERAAFNASYPARCHFTR